MEEETWRRTEGGRGRRGRGGGDGLKGEERWRRIRGRGEVRGIWEEKKKWRRDLEEGGIEGEGGDMDSREKEMGD